MFWFGFYSKLVNQSIESIVLITVVGKNTFFTQKKQDKMKWNQAENYYIFFNENNVTITKNEWMNEWMEHMYLSWNFLLDHSWNRYNIRKRCLWTASMYRVDFLARIFCLQIQILDKSEKCQKFSFYQIHRQLNLIVSD